MGRYVYPDMYYVGLNLNQGISCMIIGLMLFYLHKTCIVDNQEERIYLI